jgi:Putative beta-barrel porin-2, OmpL-like. bbp2
MTSNVRGAGWIVRILVPLLLTLAGTAPAGAQQRDKGDTSAAPESRAGGASPTMEEHVKQLESEVEELRHQVQEMKAVMANTALPASAADATHSIAEVQAASPAPPPVTDGVLTADDRSILDYLKGTTINAMFDGYYDWNFNQPVGRVNLLRAYDVQSNIFGLNQADVIFERAPDLTAGRRYGLRLDLQYGEATATLSGNPVNEPRPDVFRNIFQAYGTYIVPVGSGITVDFGKWSSSLGAEGNYTQYQINYSRSYWFNYLPFYHMGVRAHYQVNKLFGLNYWSVNGTNQTEPTNGFKDEMFGAVITPNKDVSWTINYYFGQDHPNAIAANICGPVPVQPGLCLQQVNPAPNGKTHIFDSYVTWQATPKLGFTLEGDYIIQRLWVNTRPGESSAPSDVWGGAGYIKYQLTPRTYIAARGEYLDDHGGLFTGITNYIVALKEVTATYDFQVANGFDMRWEYRRDISNQPIFLTNLQNIYSTHQDTATLGVIWWFGRKQGPW